MLNSRTNFGFAGDTQIVHTYGRSNVHELAELYEVFYHPKNYASGHRPYGYKTINTYPYFDEVHSEFFKAKPRNISKIITAEVECCCISTFSAYSPPKGTPTVKTIICGIDQPILCEYGFLSPRQLQLIAADNSGKIMPIVLPYMHNAYRRCKEVTSIEYLGIRELYSIIMPEDHPIFIGGIIAVPYIKPLDNGDIY